MRCRQRLSGRSAATVDLMPEQNYSHQKLENVGSEASLERRSVYVRYGNVTIHFGGQIDDRENPDASVAAELGRRIIANLDSAR